MKTTTITPDQVASMMAGEWDACDQDILIAVADAMLSAGDDLPADLVENLPVTVRVWDDGSSEETKCAHDDDFEEIAQELWADADYGDGDYCVTVSWEATDYAGTGLESGSFDVEGETAEPPCPEADEHDWTSEGEGGCRENPGVWSTGGTSMVFHTHCRHCGMRRIQHTTGAQCNPGECDTTKYEEVESWCQECQREECECE